MCIRYSSSFITTAISLARYILLLLRTHSIVCRHFSSTSLGPILSLSQLKAEFFHWPLVRISLFFSGLFLRAHKPSFFKFVHPSDIGHISTLFRSFFIYSCDMSICFRFIYPSFRHKANQYFAASSPTSTHHSALQLPLLL